MACCLAAPSHYPNQCWLIISDAYWHSPDNNFTGNVKISILDMSLTITSLRLQLHLPEPMCWENYSQNVSKIIKKHEHVQVFWFGSSRIKAIFVVTDLFCYYPVICTRTFRNKWKIVRPPPVPSKTFNNSIHTTYSYFSKIEFSPCIPISRDIVYFQLGYRIVTESYI